ALALPRLLLAALGVGQRMLLALDQLGDRKADDFDLGFEVRRALAADKLESLQGGRPYNPRQDNCEAIDGSRRNLALDESTLADGDQSDIGWFRLSERGNGAVGDRVRRCSFVVVAVGCLYACLLACGCQIS